MPEYQKLTLNDLQLYAPKAQLMLGLNKLMAKPPTLLTIAYSCIGRLYKTRCAVFGSFVP